ncbi:MAG: ATP synthase F1 subunit delta [Lachnospiraceae bacterium]|nr:ATP synthase F1 subunit delta [Lachnospiraceae bacterium]
MAKLISKTYGEAIFELAVSENRVEALTEEIQAVLQVLGENPDFSEIMKHPKIIKEEKLQVIETVFKGRVSDELTGFMRLIVEKDRYGNIQEIMQYFLDEVKKLKGIGVAYVTSALPLREEQKKQVEAKLLETTSFQEMEMHYQVDEKLIGGMVIRIGDRVADSSIRSKLSYLEQQLLKIQLQN